MRHPDPFGYRAPSSAAPDLGPPLALYVHVPWCVRKCPYCDFNSHPTRGELPESRYIDALLADLDSELATLEPIRPLQSIFIGGGTPSLLSGRAIRSLLEGVRARIELSRDCEITLEANPGVSEAKRFADYREAGVNRLSIGVQSLDARALALLGRIHDPSEAIAAVGGARSAGFAEINVDLMYGLPGQSIEAALTDVDRILALEPTHVSYYQLTLEPGTAFAHTSPTLPGDDEIAEIQQQGIERLAACGYPRYEISAYAAVQHRCRHNLNYWRFGDYIGIGAGAHGKRTDRNGDRIERYWKHAHPKDYLERSDGRRAGVRLLTRQDRVIEFAMNALRLSDGFDSPLYEAHTLLSIDTLAPHIDAARRAGLLLDDAGRIRASTRGLDFLNDLLQHFDLP